MFQKQKDLEDVRARVGGGTRSANHQLMIVKFKPNLTLPNSYPSP